LPQSLEQRRPKLFVITEWHNCRGCDTGLSGASASGIRFAGSVRGSVYERPQRQKVPKKDRPMPKRGNCRPTGPSSCLFIRAAATLSPRLSHSPDRFLPSPARSAEPQQRAHPERPITPQTVLDAPIALLTPLLAHLQTLKYTVSQHTQLIRNSRNKPALYSAQSTRTLRTGATRFPFQH